MGLFRKSKVLREWDERQARRDKEAAIREAATQEAEYDELVQAIERLKQFNPNWKVSCGEYSFRKNTKANIVDFSASSKFHSGMSVDVKMTSNPTGFGDLLTHASLQIKQAKIDTLDAFTIYAGNFQNYAVGPYESNIKATEYLVSYIRTVAEPLIEASTLKDKEIQERQKTIANDFWNK
jgi:hypothetical protein